MTAYINGDSFTYDYDGEERWSEISNVFLTTGDNKIRLATESFLAICEAANFDPAGMEEEAADENI